MNALLPNLTEPGFMPDMVQAAVALEAEKDAAATWEAIQIRESTMTLAMEEILQLRPPSHWGINE